MILKLIFDELGGPRHIPILIEGLLILAGFALGRELFDALSNWLTWRTRIGLHYARLDAVVDKHPPHAARPPAQRGRRCHHDATRPQHPGVCRRGLRR